MRKLFFWTLIMALVLPIVACGGDQAPPTFEPLPTPTIPPNFVTFTDESNLFSIAYPADWELALSIMAELKEIVQGIVDTKQSEIPLDKVGIVFFAGLPIQEGFDPNVNITVESLPAAMTVDEYFESGNQAISLVFTGFKSHTQTRVRVGGRDSIIEDWEYDLSSVQPGATGKVRVIQLVTTDGRVGWGVSCALVSEKLASDLQSCDAIVRSFRILE